MASDAEFALDEKESVCDSTTVHRPATVTASDDEDAVLSSSDEENEKHPWVNDSLKQSIACITIGAKLIG